ncbi:MAG: DUF1573 domain-containing protein [Saprospiraceae bacterium]|jgi:hypothetical protein|nr:DUF1573 domain-containing protein [Saprospiraceae bacterium]MBP9209183.1 DUF1573 domain-containing protein [Saprospiraceae bacterium]MBV6472959.1 hypothetical protein [Saprospiraceae bacterium]
MKKLKLFSFAVLASGLALTACKSDKADAAESTTTDASITDPGASAVPTADAAAAPTGPTTTIEFEEMVFDWGEIKEGEHVKYAYKFKNTGSEPLIIADAKGSCGCTVPDWPREPIAPGASGEIKVEFDSKGKGSDDGQKQTKKVTVTANTNPPQTYLTITGVVKKDPNAKPASAPAN